MERRVVVLSMELDSVYIRVSKDGRRKGEKERRVSGLSGTRKEGEAKKGRERNARRESVRVEIFLLAGSP